MARSSPMGPGFQQTKKDSCEVKYVNNDIVNDAKCIMVITGELEG